MNNILFLDLPINETHYMSHLKAFLRQHPEKKEQNFLTEIIDLNNQIITEYKEEDYNKTRDELLKEGYKEKFLEYRLNQIKEQHKKNISRHQAVINDCKIRLERLPKIKISKSNLLFGKKLNQLERYKIADSILNINDKFRTLNISDTEKYQLLGAIMGINPTNARLLMNKNMENSGKLKITEEVKEYIKNLK